VDFPSVWGERKERIDCLLSLTAMLDETSGHQNALCKHSSHSTDRRLELNCDGGRLDAAYQFAIPTVPSLRAMPLTT
jgi:hypothetical protein